MTVVRAILAETALRNSQRVTEMGEGSHGPRLGLTLENLIATHLQHRPSIRHRYCGPNDRPASPLRLKQPRHSDVNFAREPDQGVQENPDYDPRGDRSHLARISANMANLSLWGLCRLTSPT